LVLLAVWLCGGIVVLAFWLRSLRQIRAIKRAAAPLPLALPIPVMSSAARMEPGVFGIFNPVLILPEGITDRLTPAQFKAVLAHELCHVRRRDNLTAAIHMIVEVIFWFFPLVWWIRTQLVAERERACDEAVLGNADDPQIYAEAILNVCKLYIEAPLRCVSGVSGSDLKRRIRTIVAGRIGGELTFARKAALATAGIVTIAFPILAGVIGAPSIHARSQAKSTPAIQYEFEVASVKLNKSGGERIALNYSPDGFSAVNVPLRVLIRFAYGPIEETRILGGPDWLNSERYDIEAKVGSSVVDELQKLSPAQLRLERQRMLQALLADRFKLTVNRESRELPIYALVIAKNGPKLRESKPGDTYSNGYKAPDGTTGAGLYGGGGGGKLVGQRTDTTTLANVLSRQLGRIVLDKTGLNGSYDFTLQWTPDQSQAATPSGTEGSQQTTDNTTPVQSSGPSIFEAIQDQLGLKLESRKAPVEVLLIDHVERPSGN
jgi:uncharacterized protein (TIGR03435 family)